MSDPLVTLTIDDIQVTVPKGTLIVDAAKQVGIEIPVFCYHPKLEPAGMCRMCLVEIGRPKFDRARGEIVRTEDGAPVIELGKNLETACTTPVGEGWIVRVNSGRALEERKQVVELLLTSHPLDCPICDKGGECPLQDITMAHGPGESRFLYDEKMHLDKHVPLGELIFLDRERCIQCARCVRFQEDIAGDPVIGFTQRGRALEIVTFSNPGFDSYFSGNTTDICPVGALTTTDFRFGARPWELNAAASICTHCPVGCNLVLNTRREASSGGQETIKRVMPRQNEAVNEIWICDKGRFAHHFATSPERLEGPMVREAGKLKKVSWKKALAHAEAGLRGAGKAVVGIAGARASNEDLFSFRSLIEGLGGRTMLHSEVAGGDLVQQIGLGTGSNLVDLGQGDAILVVASDLHEEAPIWWLRLKQAAERGAALVVANARPTRLDAYAAHALRFSYGQAAHTVLAMLNAVSRVRGLAKYKATSEIKKAAKLLAKAENLVIFCGAEGGDYAATQALSQACSSLLIATKHVGRANNGLVIVWPRSNTQGAWDMGLRPHPDGLAAGFRRMKAAYVMAADPAGDHPALAKALAKVGFLVVQELFLTETALQADVVFPAQAFIEREGSYTTGERRVQRIYPAVPPRGQCRPDWAILAELGELLGLELERASAAAVALAIANAVPDYAEVNYQAMAAVEPQWPHVGGDDLYFGGTAFANKQGVGVKLASQAERGQETQMAWVAPPERAKAGSLTLVPVTRLYDHGTTVTPSKLLEPRLAPTSLGLNPKDAKRLKVAEGAQVEIRWNGRKARLPAAVDEKIPVGAALLGRSLGLPLSTPAAVEVRPIGK
ncbi:MAG: NADH-quinone oxidoreductase subunit NuoG [Anaerolineales bacterium]|jgi:NADH-quinone oxidoreductase subunit G